MTSYTIGSGGMSGLDTTDEYKKGWYDGYHAARKEWTENFRHVPPIRETIENRCVLCGKDLNKLTHYVCGQSYCPTKVSC